MNEESIAFTVVGTLLGIIGYFMKTIHKDVKRNTISSNTNKSKLDLLTQRQEDDIKRIEEITQLELKIMAEKVGELSTNVNSLVELFILDKKK